MMRSFEIKKRIKSPLRVLRNSRDRVQGISGCKCCGDTWGWKKRHDIKYSENSSMFPICEECFLSLDIENIEFYVKDLVREWSTYDPTNIHGGMDYHLIVANAVKTVKKEKGRAD